MKHPLYNCRDGRSVKSSRKRPLSESSSRAAKLAPRKLTYDVLKSRPGSPERREVEIDQFVDPATPLTLGRPDGPALRSSRLIRLYGQVLWRICFRRCSLRFMTFPHIIQIRAVILRVFRIASHKNSCQTRKPISSHNG